MCREAQWGHEPIQHSAASLAWKITVYDICNSYELLSSCNIWPRWEDERICSGPCLVPVRMGVIRRNVYCALPLLKSPPKMVMFWNNYVGNATKSLLTGMLFTILMNLATIHSWWLWRISTVNNGSPKLTGIRQFTVACQRPFLCTLGKSRFIVVRDFR